uniref:Uncharacterized protein n=1 Tax=mine drainage metagenome TaxID=410659 RepID=E6QLE6_9ZZZZ
MVPVSPAALPFALKLSPSIITSRSQGAVGRGPGHVKHEKKTFFSLLKNTRSEGISQGRPKGAAASGRSEAESLYGCRSGGYGA